MVSVILKGLQNGKVYKDLNCIKDMKKETIYNQFVEGKPANLENILNLYEENEISSNLNINELRQNVSGYIPIKPFTLTNKNNGNKFGGNPINDIYFFFKKDEGDRTIRLSESMYLSLNSDKYGFDNKKIQINPQKIKNLKLSNEATKMYEQLLNSNSINLDEILEKTGYMINSSMEYDFKKIKSFEKTEKGSTGYSIEQWKEEEKLYKPTGLEVKKGICRDAGKQIREVLFNLELLNKYGITHVQSSYDGLLHDTTLVFDKQKGNWEVINSKNSETKQFNLANKEQLKELGSPYIGEK